MSSIRVGTFNAAMGRSRGDFDGQMISRYDGTNTTGIFRLKFQQAVYYFVIDKGKQIPYPQLDQSWKEGVLVLAGNVLNIPSTRSSSNEVVVPAAADESRRNKRQRTQSKRSGVLQEDPPPTQPVDHIEECHAGGGDTVAFAPSAGPSTMSSTLRNDTTRHELMSMIYWNSQDAKKLFGVQLERPSRDVRDVLKVRIKLLQSVSCTENGWQNVIEGRDSDD